MPRRSGGRPAEAAATEWFVEQMGLSTSAAGLPRIAGRLFGYLALSPGPRSLDEIAAALGVSKGSASTDARLLERHGWLRRVGRPGDRRDYYEFAPDSFAGIVAYRLSRWEALHALVVEARRRFPRQPAAVRDRLAYLEEAERFFADGMRALLDQWARRRSRAGASR
ncbi:MAG TPA: MarR family transcriptional regulator [Gemmatimonadales bacterium]|nr:MarR family transcriptional regulator [Gemmatimonadales bacterium]